MVSERELNAFMSAISGQESGGNYTARNPDSGAYGAFQIMPANWPSWSREAGLGANAPRTQENQNKVARFKMKQYYDKFGNWEDVASAWYSGRPLSQVDQNKSQGKYPTIGSYVNSIMGKFRNNLGGDVSGRAQTSNAIFTDEHRAQGLGTQENPLFTSEHRESGLGERTPLSGNSYWSERVGQINEQLEFYEKQRKVLSNLPDNAFTADVKGQIEAIDAEIQNLQWMRDEAQMQAQQEEQAAADLALTGAQIDVQKINAAVAEGRLTLDQAIHQLNSEIQRRQLALAQRQQKHAEEQARRTQGREDAAFIDEQLDQAAAWAPQEPGKTDYTGADVSDAHGQALAGRGISPDSTIAKYSGTRVVDPQRTLAQAGGGAHGGRGSAPGMGWTDEDRAGGGEEAPAPPDTGTGTAGTPTFAGNAPPQGHPAQAGPGGGGQSQPGASFAGNTPPPGHPASTSPPPPTFAGNTPPPGHPAGGPSYSGSPPVGRNTLTPEIPPPPPSDPRGPNPRINSAPHLDPIVSSGTIRPGGSSLLDVMGPQVQGLLGGAQTGRFQGNTPPRGHPAMRRR